MVTFGIIFCSILALGLLVGGIVTVGDYNSGGGEMILFGILFALIVWGIVENADYRESEPIPVDKSIVSIMHDDKVVIVRIGDEYQRTFDTKATYDAILCDKYELVKIISYDITGEENGVEYKLITDE